MNGSHATEKTTGCGEEPTTELLPIQPALPQTSSLENVPGSPSTNLHYLPNVSTSQAIEDTVCGETLPPLSHFQEIVKRRFSELNATLLVNSDGSSILQVTHTIFHNHPPARYVHRVRIILFQAANGYHYDLQVLLVTVETGVILSEQDFIKVCNSLLHSNGFVYCPRIDYQEYYDKHYSVIRFHSKQVNLSTTPFQRVDAKGCLRWHKLPKNATLKEQASTEVLCSFCKRLLRDLEHQKKRSALVSPSRRIKRQAASSNYPTKYLSPASIQKKMHKQREQKTKRW